MESRSPGAGTIFGEYVRVDGRNYHSTCFKCAECGEVIHDKYYTHLTDYFHERCFERRFRSPCTVCGQLITGEAYEDYWGGRYCAGHVDTIPVCDFCGRLVAGPITGKGLRLPDGRLLCGVCRPSAVTNQTRAEARPDSILYIERFDSRERCHSALGYLGHNNSREL